MKTFSDLPLLPSIQTALDALGFTTPTEIQAKAIPFLLENKKSDVHAQAQTGTGKTLAFGIPLLHAIDTSLREVQGLIIAPTRELAMQIHEALKQITRGSGITIVPVCGGMPMSHQIKDIRRGAHIVVGTPGRVNDLLRRRSLKVDNLAVLVLDEADIMLDMGFKEEVDAILKLAPEGRQIWLFSATVKPGIRQLMKSHMRDVFTVKAEGKTLTNKSVKQQFCVMPMRKRVEAVSRFVEAAPSFYGIIFCQTKVLTSEVAESFASKGFKVNCLHGDMKQGLRNQVIKGFKKKDFTILVATDVAARGIDISDLTHVVNFSIPREQESYVHRIGRTGRAGKEGIAISFITPSESYRIRRLERLVNTAITEVKVPALEDIVAAKMSAVVDFFKKSKETTSEDSPVYKGLKEVIGSLNEDEMKHVFALSLEDKFFKGLVHEELTVDSYDNSSRNYDRSSRRDGGGSATGLQEICIELGKDTGFTEQMVRVYLEGICKVSSSDILKVRVLNNTTFVGLTENLLKDTMQTMRTTPITEQRHKLYFVVDKFSGQSRSPRRRMDHSSGRGRGGRGGSSGGGFFKRDRNDSGGSGRRRY